MDRRNFIKKISRNLVLGGVLATSGYLLLKPETGEECNFDFICKDCRQLKNCSLPEADDFKKKTESSKD